MKRTIDYQEMYPNKKRTIPKQDITICVLVAVMMTYFVYSVIVAVATMYLSYKIHILIS
jgi:hypothetical protein